MSENARIEAEIEQLKTELEHHQEAPLPSGPPGSPAPEPEPVSTSATLKAGTLTAAPPVPQTPAPAVPEAEDSTLEGRISSLEKTVGAQGALLMKIARLNHLTDE